MKSTVSDMKISVNPAYDNGPIKVIAQRLVGSTYIYWVDRTNSNKHFAIL